MGKFLCRKSTLASRPRVLKVGIHPSQSKQRMNQSNRKQRTIAAFARCLLKFHVGVRAYLEAFTPNARHTCQIDYLFPLCHHHHPHPHPHPRTLSPSCDTMIIVYSAAAAATICLPTSSTVPHIQSMPFTPVTQERQHRSASLDRSHHPPKFHSSHIEDHATALTHKIDKAEQESNLPCI